MRSERQPLMKAGALKEYGGCLKIHCYPQYLQNDLGSPYSLDLTEQMNLSFFQVMRVFK